METPQGNGSDNLLSTQCLDFIQSLTNQKISFKFHLTSGPFSCSFDNNGTVAAPARTPTEARKKTPSTRRRNAKRRRLFLERKKFGPSVDHESGPSANSGNLGSGEEAAIRGGDRDEEVDDEVDEEASGREREQEKNITMEDLYKALGRSNSRIVEHLSEIRKNMNDTMKLTDSRTANDPERRDEEGEGELQESDGDAEDHLIEFANRLETGIKCFQRQIETTDKKAQEARRQTITTPQSPRKKRRRKR